VQNRQIGPLRLRYARLAFGFEVAAIALRIGKRAIFLQIHG
jgi:hypothetical protein